MASYDQGERARFVLFVWPLLEWDINEVISQTEVPYAKQTKDEEQKGIVNERFQMIQQILKAPQVVVNFPC